MPIIKINYYTAVYLLFVLSSPVSALEWIKPFQVEYTVKAKGLSAAQLSQKLHIQEDGSYRFFADMKTTGFVAIFHKERISEHSIFALEGEKLIPKEYVYTRNLKKKQTRNRIDFDWKQDIARISYKGKQSEVPLEEGILDTLNSQLMLRRDLRRGIKEVTYRVAENDKISDHHFKVVGKESLRTRLGKLKTLKVRRIFDSGRSTTFWCAIDLDYLMVKIEQVDDGTTITGSIRKYQGPGDEILAKPSHIPKALR